MRLSKFILCGFLSSLLLLTSAFAQGDPQQRGKAKAHQRGSKTPVLIPAGKAPTHRKTLPAAPAPALGQQPSGNPVFQRGIEDRLSAQAANDPKKPRSSSPRARKPYLYDRAILQVNDQTINTDELNELVVYYQAYKQEVADMHLQAAVKALLPKVVIRGMYGDELAAMRTRILEAQAAIQAGQEWADVVALYSDDDPAENPQGSYTMARGKAVQPFDRLAHTGQVGKLVGPFLTVFGFHLLEITDYQQGQEAKDDVSTVRHILVMYPSLKKADTKDGALKGFIEAQVKAAKIEALEAGSANLVPIGHRQSQ
jgi:PPIC-type peptidyl-prolyl cis-trans isomerase-like protein